MMHLLHALLAANPFAIPANGITPTNGTVGQEITKVIKLLMQLIGLLSVIFVIVGGLQIVLSSGNAAHVKQGRETIIYALVGMGIAISGYAIVAYLGTHLG